MSCCRSVGNHLGAGDAHLAKAAALVPALFLPMVLLALWGTLMFFRSSFAYVRPSLWCKRVLSTACLTWSNADCQMYTSDEVVASLASSVLPFYLYSQSCSSICFGDTAACKWLFLPGCVFRPSDRWRRLPRELGRLRQAVGVRPR